LAVNELEEGSSFPGATGWLFVERLSHDLYAGSFLFVGDDEALVKERVVKAT
jgi:hypothetical protein